MSDNEPPRIPPVACSPEEFRRAVGIGKTHYHKQVKAGLIKVIHDGRKVLVPISECTAYLNRLQNPEK